MQSSSMSSKKRNLSGSFNAAGTSSGGGSGSRPSSAKEGRPTSLGTGRSSARSATSVESDFLSITGARKIPQKSGKHKRTQSGAGRFSYSHGEVSGSESDRTSSSSGARKKAVNVNQQGNLRFAENHVTPVILSQTKAKAKPKLATNFQVHQAAISSASYLPNKPQGADRNASVNHTGGWLPAANDDRPSIPPLELKSPSDQKQEQRWWPASSGDPSPASDYFSESKNDENWWEGLKTEDLDADNILASWEHTKPKDSKSASYKSDVPKLSLDELLDESQKRIEFKQQRAAVTIQRWVRGWIVRRRTNHSTLKKLLSQKKQEREKQIKWGQENVLTEEQLREKKEKERIKRREEQARLARQAAIQELQQQREHKRQENQRKAQEELQFLQASGKVTKKKANTVTKTKPKRPASSGASLDAGAAQLDSKGRSSSGANNTKDLSPRPGTSSSVGRKLDEMFQESRTAKPTSNNIPRTEENPSLPIGTDRTDKTITRSDLEGGSKTTFDDLLESLKQLEEQPKGLLEEEQRGSPVMANWMRDLEDTKDDLGKPYLSVESLGQLDAAKTQSSQGAQGTSLSAEKVRNILTFLDEVEKAEEDARSEITQVRESAVSHGLPSPSLSTSVAVDREKEMALLESASAAASDVTQAMMAVKIELEEKKRTGELLQRALNQQREFTLRQAKEMEKDAKVRIEIQRQEYEAAIQRHLSFIDQLIDDKKVLSERCEELVKKLKEIDKKYSDKIKHMEENHLLETKKQKEVIIAAEKLRREKWINEKTQQIKEVTVKGLEPDIQKLIAKHKAEMKRMKSVHQAELLEADERAGRRYIQQIEELRDQLEREKEMACSRERELAQQRYEKQMEQEEQAYQQQRRRLYAEVQEEKERLALQGQKQRQELDDARAALEGSHKKSVVDQQASHQKILEDTERRHQLEINELKERLEIEKQGWIENYMKKQDAVLLAKERELKEGVREARDREIEMVISRLEDETALTREECERAAENRIKRVRDKYESELKELEASEHNMHQKYNSMKERLTEVEGECSRFRSLLKQKEQESEDMDRVVKRLQEERGKVSDIIRQEFADRLVTTDEDNKRLKTEMSEMKARHRLETERVTQEKEREMEELHKRVKQAIAKKEETTKMLREQQQAAMKRADHLEMLLQQQREKFLK